MLKLFGNILYYPGCLKKFVFKDLEENYEKILRKCGIDFIKLKDLEVCCGSPVLNAGYLKTFEFLAKKNLRVFKEHSVKKIITSCPACFKIFKQEYPKVEGFNIEVEHITQTIWGAIQNGKLKIKAKTPLKVTYHDPCYLGRYCGIYDEPRNTLNSLGCDLVEMKFNREQSFCCGGGGGLRSNFPELAKEIAKDRIRQAEKTKAEILITSCPLCYACLKEAFEKPGIKVEEFSSFITKFIL